MFSIPSMIVELAASVSDQDEILKGKRTKVRFYQRQL